LVTAGILYFRSADAKENPITKNSITLHGKQMTVILSEKKGGYRGRNTDGYKESGTIHYGYALELLDDVSKNSLDKYTFKSPVDPVPKNLELLTLSNGSIWVISPTPREFDSNHGYLLKFEIKENKIRSVEFKLDHKYRIRAVRENKIVLTEGNDMLSAPSELNIYLDLETEQIIRQGKTKQK